MKIQNWQPDPQAIMSIAGSLWRVILSGRYILGPEVEALERELGDRIRAYVVGVASGTDALEISLRAVGVRSGDAVVTVANTAVPTVAAIRRIGAEPIFTDISDDTCLMSPTSLAPIVENERQRIRAIVPVHLYGQAAHMEEILAIAKRAGIPVVEDCAQAAGATYDGKSVGTLGAAGAWSFYPTKPLGACGDGGAVVSVKKEVADFARLFREYGMEIPQVSLIEGANSRLDAFQAAILRDRLPMLDDAIGERRRLASIYDRELAGSRALPIGRNPRSTHSHYVYVVRVKDRDQVINKLAEAGIEARVHYRYPIHLMPAYADYDGSLPMTARACSEVLSLPFWVGMTELEVKEVSRALLKVLA